MGRKKLSIEHLREVYEFSDKFGIDAAMDKFGLTYASVTSRRYKYNRLLGADGEIIVENVRLSNSRQKLMDRNRIERKSFREYARETNALEELNKELINVFSKHNLSEFVKYHEPKTCEGVGIIQLSDLHFNELVNLSNNTYDFDIASKRLQKFACEAKQLFKFKGVSSVVITDLGDKLNSDRRLDEAMSNATNRSQAQFIAIELLSQFIIDLNQDFNITYTYVVGNESRVKDELTWSAPTATDNYDYTIVQMLKLVFSSGRGSECSKGLKFVKPDSPNQSVIEINGKNFLLAHGIKFGKDPHSTISKLIRQYADKMILIYFVLFGHLHETLITDTFARNGSLVGANPYSEESLRLTSKASQNTHIVTEQGITSTKIDLQNTEGYNGYNITKELEEYNAKSADKNRVRKTIFEVRV